MTTKPISMLVAACLLTGCPSESPAGRTSPAPETPVPVTSAIASAAPTVSASAEAPPPPTFASLLTQAPTAGTRRSETVFGAGGVHAGLPPEWSTGDVYNAYLIASTKAAHTMVYLATGKGLEEAELDAFVKGAAYPIYLKDLSWDGPWDGAKVGPHGYEARVRRGKGMSVLTKNTPRVAVAVCVKIPERKTIHILGSWDASSPEIEAQFLDVVRGLGRCKHKPGRGCVAVQPVGEETELEDAPKKAPGSNPFG
jgi:hypothetical protein